MDREDFDKRLWNVKRDLGLCISFPIAGEPRNKYIEVNRQEQIRYDNLRYENGWIPDQPLNWWRRKRKGSSEPVPSFADIYVIRRG